MENKKIVKRYFKKYFESNYFEEQDLEFKSLVRILNKVGKHSKNLNKAPVSGNAFANEVKEMLDEISKLSKYNSNHDQILDNFGDIENVVKRFRQKHYR